ANIQKWSDSRGAISVILADITFGNFNERRLTHERARTSNRRKVPARRKSRGLVGARRCGKYIVVFIFACIVRLCQRTLYGIQEGMTPSFFYYLRNRRLTSARTFSYV